MPPTLFSRHPDSEKVHKFFETPMNFTNSIPYYTVYTQNCGYWRSYANIKSHMNVNSLSFKKIHAISSLAYKEHSVPIWRGIESDFFNILEWGETESTWYVGH
jgi:hypothetical protein